jgi:hypothetical protein
MRFQLNGKYEYCPNGNYWQEVSGIFDKEIYLFCDCNKCKGQVYKLKPFNITKKVDKKQIEKFKQRIKLEEVRNQVNIDNMEQVNKIINP